jgi:hypothetical protein
MAKVDPATPLTGEHGSLLETFEGLQRYRRARGHSSLTKWNARIDMRSRI